MRFDPKLLPILLCVGHVGRQVESCRATYIHLQIKVIARFHMYRLGRLCQYRGHSRIAVSHIFPIAKCNQEVISPSRFVFCGCFQGYTVGAQPIRMEINTNAPRSFSALRL